MALFLTNMVQCVTLFTKIAKLWARCQISKKMQQYLHLIKLFAKKTTWCLIMFGTISNACMKYELLLLKNDNYFFLKFYNTNNLFTSWSARFFALASRSASSLLSSGSLEPLAFSVLSTVSYNIKNRFGLWNKIQILWKYNFNLF